ncbi:membrane bound O-acyl transferase family-domain-containing protein [Parachaetomium inaequale]|uniref:Membrane bound O-acyl transferase family-domain-containing protein n=1 Tax=Parachaetomium inaequale TaxID=2588326 RepID=A0AAN6SS88_9PEZI|nr:membrane bound O-acyl transferase family-domain-containing protein [Parachaetomium inaequale]
MAPNQTNKDRLLFAALRGTRAITFWVLDRLVSHLVTDTFLRLSIRLSDFEPAHQGLLPCLTRRDLSLRAIMTVQWIWSMYSKLTMVHDLLALIFVALLGWDQPLEWPPVFGNLLEAYSLRRFWGIFWHRLHVALFDAYIPSFPCRREAGQQRDTNRFGVDASKALRPLCIFLFSAICHSVVNSAVLGRSSVLPEARFFLSNYVLCLLETLLKHLFNGKGLSNCSRLKRPLGYVWVLVVFFALTPGWQYPSIYGYGGGDQ